MFNSIWCPLMFNLSGTAIKQSIKLRCSCILLPYLNPSPLWKVLKHKKRERYVIFFYFSANMLGNVEKLRITLRMSNCYIVWMIVQICALCQELYSVLQAETCFVFTVNKFLKFSKIVCNFIVSHVVFVCI